MESKNGWLFFANRNLALAETIVDNPDKCCENCFVRDWRGGVIIRPYLVLIH